MGIFLGVVGQGQLAYSAEPSPGEPSTSPPRSETASYVADGIDGLPGIYRLGVPGTAAPRAGGSVFLNYGYTEPQNDETDGHQRFGATVSAGGALLPALAVAVRLDLRHDLHGEDALGSDSGTALDLTPLIRTGFSVSERLKLGAEARLLLSGGSDASGLAIPAFDGRLLGSYFAAPDFLLSGLLGVRTSQASDQDTSMMRPGDRVALGLSEFPALLIGLGAMKEFGRTSVFLEGTWDILVGDGAPDAFSSPLRLDLGARYRLSPGLDLQGIFEVSPSGRPASLPGDPLVPIEPRIMASVGLSIRFPQLVARPAPAQQVVEPEPEPFVEPEPAVEEPAAPPATTSLTVKVVDETGHPISDANVTVTVPATADHAEERRNVPLQTVNVYVLPEVPVGPVEISVEAELLQPRTHQLSLSEGRPAELDVVLEKDAAGGSQLRGLVRAYSGEGIEASVRVEPLGLEATCDKSGEFVLDVPPGRYDVVIEAEGYGAQKRRLRVRKDSVTVLNADLQREN